MNVRVADLRDEFIVEIQIAEPLFKQDGVESDDREQKLEAEQVGLPG